MKNKDESLKTERKLVQTMLRSGLVLSLALMLAGLIVNVSNGSIEPRAVPMFDLLSESLVLGDRLLGLGVLVLALTPALRVVTLAILWVREKDWKFVGISILVMLALIISVALGGHT